MKDYIIAVGLVLLMATAAFAYVNQWAVNSITNQTHTWKIPGEHAVSVSGQFDNVTSGSVYIYKSTNNGVTFEVLQGYSTIAGGHFNYDLDTTYGNATDLRVVLTNKSHESPKAPNSVYVNIGN